MLEAGLEALQQLLMPNSLMWLGIGTALGLVVGILPGMGGAVGLSIMLPFIYGMEPTQGIALLMGVAAVVHTADTFPAVLLGIPGSGGSQATIMDGYPLAQQGRASFALGAAFTVSMLGGIIGAVSLIASIYVARPIVLALGSPELLALSLLGLSMIGILSRGSTAKGLTASALGLLVGSVGAAVAAPQYRFTFGSLYLYDGIPIAVLALAMFAVPELLDLLVADRSISKQGVVVSGGRMEGLREAFRHKLLILRSALLGTTVGIIPGLGGAVVDWIAYGVAAQTTRTNNEFGRGDIRGVVAPESANNAKEAGAQVPTLLFGIPGSTNSAIILGGLLVLGVQPGRSMVTTGLPTMLTVVWSLALANVLATIACFSLTKQVAKISTIRATRLAPFLLVILLFASYQSTRHWGDIVAFIGLGSLSWVMKQSGWPRAPVLVGFVLAQPTERYLFLTVERYGLGALSRPGMLIILALTVMLTWAGLRLASRAAPPPGSEAPSVPEGSGRQ